MANGFHLRAVIVKLFSSLFLLCFLFVRASTIQQIDTLTHKEISLEYIYPLINVEWEHNTVVQKRKE